MPQPPTRRPLRGAALLVLVSLALTACSIFPEWDPPEAVEDAVEHTLAELRAVRGVERVEVAIEPYGASSGGPNPDDPDAWVARFSVDAPLGGASAARRLADAVDDALEELRETVPASAGLADDAEGVATPVYLDFAATGSSSAAGTAAVALALRSVPAIDSASVSTLPDPPSVRVGSARDWERVVAGIRAAPGFGGPGLRAANVFTDSASGYATLTIDGASPAAGLPAALADVFAQPGVTELRFEGVRPVEAPDATLPWRPLLTVATSVQGGSAFLAEKLAAVPDAVPSLAAPDAVPGPSAPRPGFEVTDDSGLHDPIAGYIGLPLGSPEPADALPAPSIEPPPIDPVAAAAVLEQARALVDELFAEADAAAGIAGTPVVEVVACDDGSGEQVRARTLIPIFQIADYADPAFDAIIAGWTDRGFHRADRAMGLDLYAADGLEQLSIRGTAEGISIAAVGVCTG